jgi:hypothetical protein
VALTLPVHRGVTGTISTVATVSATLVAESPKAAQLETPGRLTHILKCGLATRPIKLAKLTSRRKK